MAASGVNPFAHLLEEDEDVAEADKWRKIGASENKRLMPKYGIPKEALAMPPDTSANKPGQINPFQHLLAEENKKPNLLEQLKRKAGEIAPTMPPGVNMASGILSMAFPGKQGELVENLPQIVRGAQPTTSESVSQELGKLIPGTGIGGAATVKFGQGVKSLLTKVKPKELAYGIQKGHDQLLKQSKNIFDLIKSEVKTRGVNQIDLGKDVIQQAEKHLPQTRVNKELIAKAETGDYEAVHKLQSDLGKRGTKNLGSNLAADRDAGEEMLDIREKINDAIKNKFKQSGHEDLANHLEEANDIYRKLKKTYYSHPTIAKLVHKESRKIPANPMKVFSEESVPMKRIIK